MFTTSYFVKTFYQSKIAFFKTNLRDSSLEMGMNLDGCPGIREQSMFCNFFVGVCFFLPLLAVS